MHQLRRLQSALHYLRHADPPHRWLVHRACCPHCSGRWFVSLKPDPFMTRCLACLANGTNLSLIPVIERHRARHAVSSAWEMSTYGATLGHLRKVVPEVYTSELFPGAAPGAYVCGILNQDVQRLSFADSSLDLITSNQVFEHVEDDRQGFRECLRVLKPGGALIFSIPLYDQPATRQLALVEDGTLRHLATPEYHDSRHGGPRSALCFWRHSRHDIAARVSSVGFQAQLVEVRFPTTLKEATFVVYAMKT